MIRLDGVAFDYGQTHALSDVSLRIQDGEFLGIIGPNSSGKSTLLKIMSGILKPSRGEVEILSRALAAWSLSEVARTLTVVESEEHFAFPFTVEQIVLTGRTPYIPRGRRETPHDIEVAQQAMRETDVWNLRARAIHRLSSGERQRVLLARALAQEPRILLMDEPTAHLDIGHELVLFEKLQKLRKAKKLTVVAVLHDLALARQYCDRLVLLHQGCVHAAGNPDRVLTDDVLETVYGVPHHLISIVSTKGKFHEDH